MTAKRVIPRDLAQRDVQEAIVHYLAEAGEEAALGFVDALEGAYRHIVRYPARGSSRHGRDLDLPGLRSWPLKRYPYLVFYMSDGEVIDVWRVLHAERDIPAWMRQGEKS